jgi:gamma-glutamyltranspeptidase/glutathione hydrolase
LSGPGFIKQFKAELLSRQKAEQAALQVRQSVAQGRPLVAASDGRSAGGTIHLNAVDDKGLSVALTFTHGDGFGAHATVDGLGLLLGHGLSRFDPEPGRANSPASGKRPLHNMCPTLVTRDGRVELTIGATGGRRIVSAVTNVLAHYLGSGLPIREAIKMPRLHCEGGLDLLVEPNSKAIDTLTRFGFVVQRGGVASLTAIHRNSDGSFNSQP